MQSSQFHLQQADAAFAAGQLEQALAACEAAISSELSSFAANLLAGIICFRLRRFSEAEQFLGVAVESDLGTGRPSLWLAKTLRAQRRLPEAISAAQSAAKVAKEDPAAQHELGACLYEALQFERAAEAFQRALDLDPKAAGILFALGSCQRSLAQPIEAAASFRRALVLSPNSERYAENLYLALVEAFEFEEAASIAKAVPLFRSDAKSHLRAAAASLLVSDPQGAREGLERSEMLGWNSADLLFDAGLIRRDLGEIDDSTRLLEKAIELDSSFSPAYSVLAFLRKPDSFGPQQIERMTRLATDAEGPTATRGNLELGIGKVLEGQKQFETAFQHYLAGNILLKGNTEFIHESYRRNVDQAIGRYSRPLLPSNLEPGHTGPNPIFVVGMIRSGTTLVDRILSSHPRVGSVGEQGYWILRRDSRVEQSQLAAEYLQRLQSSCPDKDWVVDKMPDNFRILPLLVSAIPNCRIIHLRRNPVDTCLSIFTTLNRQRLDWAHDLGDLAFAYQQYQRVMDAWRQVLPEGSMLELDYESVVDRREDSTRRLLEFCSLEWDEACLYPERNSASVSTPSVWQVRQPVYRSSIDRWKRFEPWLGPLLTLLN